jgi:hypothetical protein
MDWFLTTPDDFSLQHTLKNSRELLLPPFTTAFQGTALERIERLTSGRTLLLIVREKEAGLSLNTDQQLTGSEMEELSRKSWRMLRLGENFNPFRNLTHTDPKFQMNGRRAVRFLRGTTFFEDVIKAVVLAHAQLQSTHPYSGRQILARLVEHVGSALSSNPTRHAFPTCRQIWKDPERVRTLTDPALGEILLALSAHFNEAKPHIQQLQYPELPLEELKISLSALPGMTPCALALVMLALGRYEYVPTTINARRCLEMPTTPGLSHWAGAWSQWGGLLYWLWDEDIEISPTQRNKV